MDNIDTVFKALPYRNQHKVASSAIAESCGIERNTALRCLRKLEADGKATREGAKRGTKWGRT